MSTPINDVSIFGQFPAPGPQPPDPGSPPQVDTGNGEKEAWMRAFHELEEWRRKARAHLLAAELARLQEARLRELDGAKDGHVLGQTFDIVTTLLLIGSMLLEKELSRSHAAEAFQGTEIGKILQALA